MGNDLNKKNYGGAAFIPLLVFLALYLGSGIFFELQGAENPFKQIPRVTALLVGVGVALIYGNHDFEKRMDIFTGNCGNPGVMLMIMIFILAGSFSGVAKAMGGAESAVNLGLTYIPTQFIIAGVFIISAFVATAMGTSMGTIAAIGPIAFEIASKAGLAIPLAMGAVVGGAMFGDNLSIISDTTIAACQGVGAEMRDKFKMNFLIALPAALVSIVLYCILGTGAVLEGEYTYSLIKVIPYIAILVAALAGVNVLIVLLGGIVLAGVIGIAVGSLTVITLAQAIANGAMGMMDVVIASILIRGMSALIQENGGIDWLIAKVTKNVKSQKGAEFSIAGLVALIDAALANNTIAIMIAAPIAKEIGEQYGVTPQKNASLLDIFSCVAQGMVPQGGQLILAGSIASLSPVAIMSGLYYQWLLAIAAIISIIVGYQGINAKKSTNVAQ